MTQRERIKMLRLLKDADLLIDSLVETAEDLSPFAKRTRRGISATITKLEKS